MNRDQHCRRRAERGKGQEPKLWRTINDDDIICMIDLAQRLANPRNVPLAFCHTYREEEAALLGPDPWAYGLSDLNQRNYGTLVRFVHDQVLDGKQPVLQDLFAKESFELKLPLPRLHEIKYNF